MLIYITKTKCNIKKIQKINKTIMNKQMKKKIKFVEKKRLYKKAKKRMMNKLKKQLKQMYRFIKKI